MDYVTNISYEDIEQLLGMLGISKKNDEDEPYVLSSIPSAWDFGRGDGNYEYGFQHKPLQRLVRTSGTHERMAASGLDRTAEVLKAYIPQ